MGSWRLVRRVADASCGDAARGAARPCSVAHPSHMLGDALKYLGSTNVYESGILRAVHSVEFLASTGGLSIPSLSDSVRGTPTSY